MGNDASIHIDFNAARQQLGTILDTRKKLLNSIGKIYEAYENCALGAWDGKYRIDFHTKVFGRNNIDGYIPFIQRKCGELNEQIWDAAVYCSIQSNGVHPDAEWFLPTNTVVQYKSRVVNVSVSSMTSDFVNLDGWAIDEFLNVFDSEITAIKSIVVSMENASNALKSNGTMGKDTCIVKISKNVSAIVDDFNDLRYYLNNQLIDLKPKVEEMKKNQDPAVRAKYF